MKIKEAIKILEGFDKSETFTPNWDVSKALKLGIEALKDIEKGRKGTFPILLQGETE